MKKKWFLTVSCLHLAGSKTRRIMKLVTVLLLVSSLQLSAEMIYGQENKLSIHVDNTKVADVLNEIENQTSFKFAFSSQFVDLNRQVNLQVENADLLDVLLALFVNTEVDFQVENNFVILTPKGGVNENESKNAQQKDVTVAGRVVDDSGEPIPGVTVTVKGTTSGTVTNMEGDFSMTIPADSEVLVFSFVGMKTREVTFGGQTAFEIVLREETLDIEEVVVVGYGIQKKSDLTGAVASVKSDKLSKISASNPAEALQGRLAGVSITAIGGAPGGGMDIKIRGASTMNNNNPLVIIDGVPGQMSMLNSSDIESIEVLKDGAAAAIYGTEAANGVILVTTKKGVEGELTINVSAKWASQMQTSELKMANTSQYMKVANMMYENGGQAKPPYLNQTHNIDTDWVDAVMRKAPMQEYDISFSGGSKSSQYYLSAGWLDQEGTIIGTDYQKANLRSKIDFEGDWLKGGVNISYNETQRNNLSMSIREVYEILPMVPVYDSSNPDGYGFPDSEGGGMPANNNPVGVEFFNDSQNSNQYFSGVGYLSFDLFTGLNFKFEAGLNNSNSHSFLHHPSYNVNAKEEVLYPGVFETRTNWREYNINNLLNYEKKIEDHKINLMAGYVLKKETREWMDAGIDGFKKIYKVDDGNLSSEEVPTGFLDEYFNTLDAGQDGESTVGGSRTVYTRASALGRLNYSFKDRYLLQATVRRDGSSKFGPDSRYGTFPSVALGWRISEEGFMQDLKFLSSLKLRGSYGVLGNENSLGLYEYMALMTTSTTEYLSYSKGAGEAVWLGTIARDLANRDYRWETTKTINIGLDFGLWNSKLIGSVNYYNNKTTDMLVRKPIPPSAGLNTPRVNFGEMENSGVELELTWQNNIGAFEYSLFGALSTTHNEVTKLGYLEESIPGYGLKYGTEHFVNQTRVGEPIGAFFLFQTDGIFQNQQEVDTHNEKGTEGQALQPNAEPGDVRFKDVNNDGFLNEEDKVFSGTPIPKFNYSFSLDARYKGFDLAVLLHGSGGHEIYNGNRYYYESMLTGRNFLANTVNAWTPQNTETDVPRAVLGDPNQNSRESTRFLEDGDFLRIKNIQVGYTLPEMFVKRSKIHRARVYVSGQNLFTVTNYSGQDPEVGNNNVLSPGLDTALYPISAMYLLGVQISF